MTYRIYVLHVAERVNNYQGKDNNFMPYKKTKYPGNSCRIFYPPRNPAGVISYLLSFLIFDINQ